MQIQEELYFSISAKDAPGEMARITAKLMRGGVEMEGIWGFSTGRGAAEVVSIPRDPDHFQSVAGEAGWHVRQGQCFRIEGQDSTGALVTILENLANEGINLQVVDALAVEGNFACYLWGREDDAVQISQVLGLRTPLA